MESHPLPPPPVPVAGKAKTSGLAIGSLVCGLLGCLGLTAIAGIVLGIMGIRQVNASNGTMGGKGLAVGGLIISSISLVLLAVGCLYFFTLNSTLGQAKAKANRIKCANNLKTYAQAMQSMSFDIDGSTPHLYGAFAGEDGHQLARALGYSSYDDAYDIERWMSAYSLRNGLSVTGKLVSPLDPKAVEAHRRYSMKDFAEARDNPISIPPRVQSYAIAMQGDLKAGETVMAMTRNIKDTEPNYRQNYIRSWGGRNDAEIWKYPNEDRSYNRHKGAAHISGSGFKVYEAQFKGADDLSNGIGQLEERQGNWVTSSGATGIGSEAEFNMQLNVAEDNFPEGDAISPGLNLIILRPEQ